MNIAFVDCETTHLHAEIGEAWEVAVILRKPDGSRFSDTEHVWQFAVDLEAADPDALRISRYRERHLVDPTWGAAWTGPGPIIPLSRESAIEAIVSVLSGAVLVGGNPAFADRFLRKLLGPGGAQWHYRPYDIVQLAAAKIGTQAAGPLPWSSYVLARAVGVEPPSNDVAHTALGDARWARDVYDAAMAREKFPLSWEGRAQHAIGLYTETAVQLEDARRDLTEMRRDYEGACVTVADMHAAATGRTGLGPIRGVVEDVADVRAAAERTAKALHIHLHALRARPGREITTDFVRAVLERLIEHPEDVCDLDQNEAAIARVRQVLGERWLATPHGDDDHDHLCPDDVRTAVLAALDAPSQPVMTGSTEPCPGCGCAGHVGFCNTCGCLDNRAAVSTNDHHYGRAWEGHQIEDACPCTKAPCGLVVFGQAAPECAQHKADKSMRQSHPADACPGPDAT